MSLYSSLAVIVLDIGLFMLCRHSLKCMDKEVNAPGQPSVWTHILILESLLFVYVTFHLVWGALSTIAQW